MQYLTVDLMEKMCHPLAVAILDKRSEPIPAFRPHTEQLLESALGLPKQSFNGKDLYPTIEEKAAILFFTLIKNHPFQNGNKRIATASFLVFLFINDFWLNAESRELAEWAIVIAELKDSNKISRQTLLLNLQKWIKNHLMISERK